MELTERRVLQLLQTATVNFKEGNYQTPASYLEGREKEVIDIMITLFGQEYAVEAYAEEKSKAGEARGKAIGKIEGAISTYYEDFHFSPMEIIGKIRERFSLDEDDAKTYVEETLGVKLNQSTLVMAEESIPFQKN